MKILLYHLFSVAVHPNGSQIYTGSADKTVKVFDTNGGNVIRSLDGHTDAVKAVTNSGLVYQNVVRTEPGTIASAFAPGLGWALGGAIGVKLAHPDRRVVAICGDGSFLFGVPSSALMMAAEMQTPFLTVILNNDGYRASRLPVYELFPEGASAVSGDAIGTTFCVSNCAPSKRLP